MTTPLPAPAALVPHTPPSLLLDQMLHVDAERVMARVRITERSLFFENGGVPAIVSLEYMAQAIAAYAGAQHRDQGLPVSPGLLVGCRLLALEVDSFAPGDELQVEVRRVSSTDRLGQFDCEVVRAGQRVAHGVLNVYQGPPGEPLVP